MRATKNIEQAMKDYTNFIVEVVAVQLAKISLQDDGYKPSFTLTKRFVQDTYGAQAAEVFAIMFKLLQRGGFSAKSNKGFKSVWVANSPALEFWLEWQKTTTERTCRALAISMKEAGLDKIEWNKHTKSWVPQALRAASLEQQRQHWVEQKQLTRTTDELEQHNATYF